MLDHFFFFFKQKTAYEIRKGDWSSDVCSSDLEMMQAAGSAKLVYLAWIVGGVFSFFGAVTYAQLGAMKPQSGGEYVYIRDAFGPLAGFLVGWTWMLVIKPSSLAAISTGI